jgi:cytochrome c oxidase cbb3-type subunit 4
MLRHFADSWGLLAMVVTFLVLVLWPFRPGAHSANEAAKTMIFKDDDDGR